MSAASANHKTPIYKVLYFRSSAPLSSAFSWLSCTRDRCSDEALRRRLHPPHQNDHRARDLLHGRDRHCGHGGHEEGRKTGGLALLYFEVVSTIALIIGLIIVNTVQPGVGMHVDPNTLDQAAVSAYTGPGKMQTTTEFLMNVIPNTVVGALPTATSCRCSSSPSSSASRCTSSAVAAR